jgi:RNA recognition motif-containing protein
VLRAWGSRLEPQAATVSPKSSRKESTISSTIFIGNLSFDTTEEELRTVLTDVDPGVRVRLGKDRMTGKPRGFAFAEFSDPAKAADAIRRFDSFELGGRRLRVNDADDKPPARAPRPFVPSSSASAPPPMAFDPGFDMGGGGGAGFNRKGGSRRGLRAKKRSLRY